MLEKVFLEFLMADAVFSACLVAAACEHHEKECFRVEMGGVTAKSDQ